MNTEIKLMIEIKIVIIIKHIKIKHQNKSTLLNKYKYTHTKRKE